MNKSPIQQAIEQFQGSNSTWSPEEIVRVLKNYLPIQKNWAEGVWEAGFKKGRFHTEKYGNDNVLKAEAPDFTSFYSRYEKE